MNFDYDFRVTQVIYCFRCSSVVMRRLSSLNNFTSVTFFRKLHCLLLPFWFKHLQDKCILIIKCMTFPSSGRQYRVQYENRQGFQKSFSLHMWGKTYCMIPSTKIMEFMTQNSWIRGQYDLFHSLLTYIFECIEPSTLTVKFMNPGSRVEQVL